MRGKEAGAEVSGGLPRRLGNRPRQWLDEGEGSMMCQSQSVAMFLRFVDALIKKERMQGERYYGRQRRRAQGVGDGGRAEGKRAF